jgi:superfamily II RNA helicase
MSKPQLSTYLNYLDYDCTDKISEPAITYPFELDHFQKHAHFRTSINENVLVTAHTGSGKTVVAEYGIAQSLRNKKRVIYTSPIKSLSNQKFKEFKEKFPDVGIMTGDIKFNPDAQCLIITTEILRNILYRFYIDQVLVSSKMEGIVPMEQDSIRNNPQLEELRNSLIMTDPKKYIDSIECVVFDEVHYINNKERGKVWEETIVMLPSRINLIMLSATIDESKKFASWIGDIKQKPINLIPTKKRPIPLRHHIYLYHYDKKKGDTELYLELSNTIEKQFESKNYDEAYSVFKSIQKDTHHSDLTILNRLVDFLKERKQFPVIFFTFSRKKCEQYAKFIRAPNLVDSKESSEIANIFDYNMNNYKDTYQILPQYSQLRELLLKGVAVHHSGLMPILKEVIEILFAKGLIKILFATETFAVGVNMPTKSVVYTELDKYTDSTKRYLHPDEYQQMSGRAGRRGLDTNGTVIYCPIKEIVPKTDLSTMMLGNSPKMISKFSLNYQLILRLYLQNKQNHILEYVEQSLYKTQLLDDVTKMENDLIQREKDIMDFPKDWAPIVEKYYQLTQQMNNGNKIKQNQLKKIRKEMTQIEADLPNLETEMDRYKLYQKKCDDIEELKSSILQYPKLIAKDLEKNAMFLEENGFIKDNQITLKGIYSTEINECNEILLTEIIYNEWFNDCQPAEIVAILSMFIHEGKSDDGDILPKDLDINKNIKDFIYYMQDVSDYYVKQESKYQIYSDSIWTLNLNLVYITYLWASGSSIKEIYPYMEIYEGNFIRSILQINNLVQSIMNICEMVGNHKLYNKLEDIESILIRDMVTIDSLYIR